MNPLYKVYTLLFSKPKFSRLNHILHRMALHGMGLMNDDTKLSGEAWLIREFIAPLESPQLIDVGANVGNFSKQLKKLCPSAKIIAFEPHPKSFAVLQKINGIQAKNLAVSNSDRNAELFDYDTPETTHSHASLHEDVFKVLHNRESLRYKVMTVQLDQFCFSESIACVHFLKIDTEGHELDVLEGAKQLIEERKIKMILFEFNEMNVVRRVFLKDFRKLLKDYTFYRLLPRGLLPIPELCLQSEILPTKIFSVNSMKVRIKCLV